ncbi:2,3-bisphosphoglycerate-independent phosphoglycerate mutase, partial [Candidatus Saccharibacteria bacterium]|nr:2,3-bisphosphoglycerate-independent phosphoglycerate mutase [Candidatus Saccharibacteria bacterium]
MNNLHYDGPITLVVLDGVGLRDDEYGNAVLQSHSEFIDQLFEKYPWVSLEASGEAVGILKGQMGNSEVGHNALGAGQIIKQGIAKIEDDFKTGAIWQTEAWRGAIENVKNHNSTLHFSGIFSDGGVHSSLDQLLKMLEQAKNEGIAKIRIHLILDGRDVPPQSADTYIRLLEDKIDELKKQAEFPLDYRIACGGGRMLFLADRYEADWNIVKTGWSAMVYGKADQYFTSAMQAIEENRKLSPGLQDQYFPSFVITEPGTDGQADPSRPVGLVQDGDSFIFYSFRADRAIETAKAFTEQDFHGFDR